jgi:hypothetical protein
MTSHARNVLSFVKLLLNEEQACPLIDPKSSNRSILLALPNPKPPPPLSTWNDSVRVSPILGKPSRGLLGLPCKSLSASCGTMTRHCKSWSGRHYTMMRPTLSHLRIVIDESRPMDIEPQKWQAKAASAALALCPRDIVAQVVNKMFPSSKNNSTPSITKQPLLPGCAAKLNPTTLYLTASLWTNPPSTLAKGDLRLNDVVGEMAVYSHPDVAIVEECRPSDEVIEMSLWSDADGILPCPSKLYEIVRCPDKVLPESLLGISSVVWNLLRNVQVSMDGRPLSNATGQERRPWNVAT